MATDTDPLETRLERQLGLTRLTLLLERLAPCVLPFAVVVAGAAALALSDILPHLPAWLHLAALVALLAAAAGAATWGTRRFRMPDTGATMRRLEEVNALDHRPLRTLDDRLAGGADDAVSMALWDVHRRRLLTRLGRLRAATPRPVLAAADPRAIRVLAVLFLLVAMAMAAGDYGPRLARAVTPDLAGTPPPPVALDLWVVPPEYLAAAPILLHEGPLPGPDEDDAAAEPAPESPLALPAGSRLLARINGGAVVPSIDIDGTRVAFQGAGLESWRAETVLTAGTTLSVTRPDAILATWPITVVADAPPTIALTGSPDRTDRGALRIEYRATDDHGIAAAAADITLAVRPDDEPIRLTLPLPGLRLKEAVASSYHDLTAHPWAGVDAVLTLEATDIADQTGRSEPLLLVLPEREFRHPVARAIVTERKKLTVAPGETSPVADAVDALSRRPGAFHGDLTVFLGLRSTAARLRLARDATNIPSIQALMWDLALRIEDGEVSIAERTLREAEQAVMDALARNAPDEELERLMDELQEAIDDYLDALAQQLTDPARPQQMMPIPPDQMGQIMRRQDIQQMLQQARDLAKSGARDAAREMLSQLRDMLANMRAGVMQQQQATQPAWQALSDLQELMQNQQELMDETFRRMREQGLQDGQPGQQGQMGQPQMGQPQMGQGQRGQGDFQGGRGLGRRQEALRRQLGELMRQMDQMMGEIPGPFGRAERSMKGAAGSLGGNQPGPAVQQQGDALDALRQGAESVMNALAEQFAQGQGQGQQPGGQAMPLPMQQGNRDPFGRPQPNNGTLDTGTIGIPEGWQLERAREIFEELRRRAAEPARPVPERDYLERLLKRF